MHPKLDFESQFNRKMISEIHLKADEYLPSREAPNYCGLELMLVGLYSAFRAQSRGVVRPAWVICSIFKALSGLDSNAIFEHYITGIIMKQEN